MQPDKREAQPKRRGRGRPVSLSPKVFTGIRLDADVLDALRQSGPGWQTRVNELLRRELGCERASVSHRPSRASSPDWDS